MARPTSNFALAAQPRTSERRITLLEATERQGLAAALNRGVALHHGLDRDVVILRGDTEVAGDWLDRLARHARARWHRYGGSACQRRWCCRLSAIGGRQRDTSGTVGWRRWINCSNRANAGAAVEVPLSFGPCIYVRRELA